MFNPAQQGFGRYASNSGFKALGVVPGLNYEAGAELGSAALAAKAKIKAAKYQADATRYQGRQARNAAIFGGAMDLAGSLGGAAIKSGMFKSGGGTDASSILTNPNIPDMGYKPNLGITDYGKYQSAFTNPKQFYGNTFGGF